MKYLSVDHAAQMVGVSSATIRNWAKAGHISPVKKVPLAFSELEVLGLRNQLRSGELQKLKIRANKAHSEASVLPNEYASNIALVKNIEAILGFVQQGKLDIQAVLFTAALRILVLEGEVVKKPSASLFDLNSFTEWKRQAVKAEIEKWCHLLTGIERKDSYLGIYDLVATTAEDDYLGLLYQCLSAEGQKSLDGAYYTPSEIVKNSLQQFVSGNHTTFLDPCCGTGKYLTVAAKLLRLQPENIYGFDIDAAATRIARINLLIIFKNKEFSPHIYCLDSLSHLATGEMFCETNKLLGAVDIIATNPPWGAHKNRACSLQVANQIKSGETFAMFLAKAICLLKEGGELSFLLPESILKIRTHADIRQVILTQGRIKKIVKLGRPFTGVFTSVIRIDFIKGKANSAWLIPIEENEKIAYVEQGRFLSNDYYAFDINVTSHEETLLNKIYAITHVTLANNADWALGVVTGNNKKFILEHCVSESEAIFRGTDIQPYKLGEPRSFVHFLPANFQQVAPERFFRLPEKLVYRFISKTLVFAYDDKQQLTLNSANILVPRIPNMSIKVALAYLNSSVFQYLFKKKFSTHKVLRGDLEKLPFPILAREVHDKIEVMVEAVLAGSDVVKELDEYIFSTFNLLNQEILLIKDEVTH